MFSFSTHFTINPASVILGERGLLEGGRVQQFVDSEVLRLCEPYVPKVTGTLSASGPGSTRVGSGMVTWSCYYGPYQYYKYGDSRSYDPQRGGHWFDRAKVGHKEEILAGARRMAGAR